MVYEPAGVAAFRQRLLTAPGERQEVDYKQSVPFEADSDFSLKLVRQILGMANAGGGWLVIGFKQSDRQGWTPDPAHSEQICTSYEPTQLSKYVNSHVARGQQISLSVYAERHHDTTLSYPVICVNGFERTPYICRSDKPGRDPNDRILKQGTVYIRRSSAETSEVSTPSDWENLIARCVKVRREEFLSEFRMLFERMNSSAPVSRSGIDQLKNWAEQMRQRAFAARS